MRRAASLALLLMVLIYTGALGERPEVLYFFENYCESCHPE